MMRPSSRIILFSTEEVGTSPASKRRSTKSGAKSSAWSMSWKGLPISSVRGWPMISHRRWLTIVNLPSSVRRATPNPTSANVARNGSSCCLRETLCSSDRSDIGENVPLRPWEKSRGRKQYKSELRLDANHACPCSRADCLESKLRPENGGHSQQHELNCGKNGAMRDRHSPAKTPLR